MDVPWGGQEWVKLVSLGVLFQTRPRLLFPHNSAGVEDRKHLLDSWEVRRKEGREGAGGNDREEREGKGVAKILSMGEC